MEKIVYLINNKKIETRTQQRVFSLKNKEYYPKYVEKEKFYIVMEKVALIFNYMENFKAKYEPPKKIEKMRITNASLDIYISS